MFVGANESSYSLYISVEEFDISCFVFSICNHFGHRRNVMECLEKKQTIEELLSLH